jgi:hypothetical protein
MGKWVLICIFYLYVPEFPSLGPKGGIIVKTLYKKENEKICVFQFSAK